MPRRLWSTVVTHSCSVSTHGLPEAPAVLMAITSDDIDGLPQFFSTGASRDTGRERPDRRPGSGSTSEGFLLYFRPRRPQWSGGSSGASDRDRNAPLRLCRRRRDSSRRRWFRRRACRRSLSHPESQAVFERRSKPGTPLGCPPTLARAFSRAACRNIVRTDREKCPCYAGPSTFH